MIGGLTLGLPGKYIQLSAGRQVTADLDIIVDFMLERAGASVGTTGGRFWGGLGTWVLRAT